MGNTRCKSSLVAGRWSLVGGSGSCGSRATSHERRATSISLEEKFIKSRSIRTLLRKNHIFLWGPVVVYYGFIFLLSSWNPPETFKSPFYYFDKAVHFLEFGLLGALMARSLSWEGYFHHLRKWGWFVVVLLLPILAAADEYHQLFVPGREMDHLDWFADIAGGFTGIFICWRIYRRRFRIARDRFLR